MPLIVHPWRSPSSTPSGEGGTFGSVFRRNLSRPSCSGFSSRTKKEETSKHLFVVVVTGRVHSLMEELKGFELEATSKENFSRSELVLDFLG